MKQVTIRFKKKKQRYLVPKKKEQRKGIGKIMAAFEIQCGGKFGAMQSTKEQLIDVDFCLEGKMIHQDDQWIPEHGTF